MPGPSLVSGAGIMRPFRLVSLPVIRGQGSAERATAEVRHEPALSPINAGRSRNAVFTDETPPRLRLDSGFQDLCSRRSFRRCFLLGRNKYIEVLGGGNAFEAGVQLLVHSKLSLRFRIPAPLL